MQDDFVLGKKLGEGSFGVVYRVTLANKPSSKVLLFVKSLTCPYKWGDFHLQAGLRFDRVELGPNTFFNIYQNLV